MRSIFQRTKATLTRLLSRFAEASNAKYRFGQSAKDYEGIDVWAFRPKVAFAWKTLNEDRTRFDWD
jgi:hypothetical protein